MNPTHPTGPNWSTASYGAAADTSPAELSALGEHMHLCRASCGRLFALRCHADAMRAFVSAHLVTTLLVLAALLAGLGVLVL